MLVSVQLACAVLVDGFGERFAFRIGALQPWHTIAYMQDPKLLRNPHLRPKKYHLGVVSK